MSKLPKYVAFEKKRIKKIMLTSPLKVLVNNQVKESFYEKIIIIMF